MSLCPIDPAILADYWLATLPPAEEEPLELHLLACDTCAARLREVEALIEAVRHLARSGTLRLVVTNEFVTRLAAGGAHVRQYDLEPGGSVQCTVIAEDDHLIARLAADLTGVTSADLCLCDSSGAELHRLPDIPIHTGAVVYQESIAFAKASPTSTMIARLVTRDPAGHDRLLGEYTFHHTRSIPD